MDALMTSRLGTRAINVTWYLKPAQNSFSALKMHITAKKINKSFINFELKRSLYRIFNPVFLFQFHKKQPLGFINAANFVKIGPNSASRLRLPIPDCRLNSLFHFQIQNLKSRKRTNDKNRKTDITKLQKSRFVGGTRERSPVFSETK